MEDVLGHFRFLVFYILCGVLASIMHIIMNPLSTVPVIGASGAIAGILGAYLFLFPRARILVLVPIFFFFDIIEISALVFIGFWFVFQFFQGFSSALSVNADFGSIAWWAHIGGFLSGLILVLFVKKKRRKLW